ncbi:MAG: GTPase Era [Nitrospirota bacterium]|nr:MAG: GTPase Era [Nitrospirota bacterium]
MKFGTLAIVGRPNVGKSTLLNALVKQKVAIVSDKPQTTRTRVLGVGHYPNVQLALIDTPGLHKPKHRLNTRMVQTALGVLPEADVVYILVDASKAPGTGDRFVIDQLDAVSRSSPYRGVFLLLNKVDQVRKSKILPLIDSYRQLKDFTAIVPISAKTGANLERLIELTQDCLPEEEQVHYDEDFLTDQSMRHMAAEIIREKVLDHTRAELPYAVAVFIDEFKEEPSRTHISATILVDKGSQKAIVIGKGGQRLKSIGTQARIEMEYTFNMKIFLELWVKVQEGWRDNDRLLIELGYH